MPEYYLIETKDLNGDTGVGGGLTKRNNPGESISDFIGVNSVEEYASKVEKLGGKVIQPKMAVPGWGYLVVCLDTENNTFGLWEDDTNSR
ncbi:VOC family protein [Chloroflexota bacterium]